MAAPSYAQSMLDSRMHVMHAVPANHAMDSEGELSSIPDISTVATFSDTDESESPAAATLDRRKRGFVSALKSRLHRQSSHTATTSSTAITQQATHDGHASVTSFQEMQRQTSESDSEVVSRGHSRTGSIVTLSRLSFANRLSQLTSIPLPTASALSARISSQTTAHLAAKSLAEAGDQIKVWTRKASDVLQDLDAQDDVEWSAAGGGDGLEEMDQAILRFEGLVKVYVISMEELQMRSDVRTLSDETLKFHVEQMDSVVTTWSKVKQDLKGVKEQVETSLEWDELWNQELGGVGQELNALGELIFDMEEQRHRSIGLAPSSGSHHAGDFDDLSDLADGTSGSRSSLYSQGRPNSFASHMSPENTRASSNKDDSTLLALFARMQPLRASLDFLPIKLSSFTSKASTLFPSGCAELEERREQLETQWKKLDIDAEALRKELGEDRWLTVFRSSGQQALKMFESVERSKFKLSDAVDTGLYQGDPRQFARLAENFEAKKTHYVPAIDRVLALIDKGIKDRLTVNGEILRRQSEMKRRRTELAAAVKDLDDVLDQTPVDAQGQHLRDSISTILSSEKSRTSSALDSPRSSPASSIMMRSRTGSVTGQSTPTPLTAKGNGLPKVRSPSGYGLSTPTTRPSRLGDIHRTVTSPLPRTSEPYSGKKPELFREFKDPSNKPRWNAGGRSTTSTDHKDFPPLSTGEPSPYRKMEPSPRKYTPSRPSLLPVLSDRGAPSPSPETTANDASARRRSTLNKLPPRASSAMEHRSVSASAKLTPPARRTSSGRLQPPSTPLTTRKYSAATKLPTLRDEDDSSAGAAPSSISRSTSRMSISRPPSSLSTATNTTRASTAAQSTKTVTSSGRRSSLATSTPGGGRRVSSLFSPPQGVWSRGGGRDSRTGMRAASAMGVTRVEEEGKGKEKAATAERPRWR